MGHDNFMQAIDHKIKSGDRIEWEEPEGDGMNEPTMDEPKFEAKLDHYVKIDLPPEIDAAVWRHMDMIAVSTTGRRLQTKVEDAFKSYREMYQMRVKSHENAVRHGFPTHTQRWFERPIYRYQQACIGLGPFFSIGSHRPGEMTDIGMFNQAWINDNLSEDGRQAAEQFLELWNGWCRANLQGRPIAPIGVSAVNYSEEERHLMFKNESGLVPTHLPWIIKGAVEWMEKYPCKSNLVPRIEQDVIDHYGRHLEAWTIDMKLCYHAEGRQVGAMTIHDFWFERRTIVDLKSFEQTKNLNVMVTTFTAKKRDDPYNCASVVERPLGEDT
eukprot:2482678-Amphidinium_carterae.2